MVGSLVLEEVDNMLFLEKEFNQVLKDNNMYNENFFQFLEGKEKKLPSGTDKSWYGCFPILDENEVIKDIRLLVPELLTEEDLLINIHEYTHAFEIYNELGKVFEERINKREELAKTNEKKYFLKRFNKVLKNNIKSY